MQAQQSDHKPVMGIFSIPNSQSTGDKRLARTAPYPIDRSYYLKRWIGQTVDKLVGTLWCTVALLGLGNDKVGLFVFVVAVLVGLASNTSRFDLRYLLDYVSGDVVKRSAMAPTV